MHASRSFRVLLQAAFLLVFVAVSAHAQDSEIRIGAVLPLTGKESKIGGAYKQATEFAVKEVNDAGGLDMGGKKVKIALTLLDDTSDAAKSAQLVEQLCARVAVLAHGRVVRSGTLDQVAGQAGLEQAFIDAIGSGPVERELSWFAS